MTYRPPYFRLDDRARLLELIDAYPLASLITAPERDIVLTYVPLLARMEGDDVVLEGHIARANDQWRYDCDTALAAFTIAGHYISPTWYPSNERDPRTVPTYDYVSVQARGAVTFIHDEDWLRGFVRRLTESQESRVGGTWRVDDAPPAYLESQIKAIVGVRLRCEALTGTLKLNQNHPRENRESVVAALRALGTPQATTLATFMAEAGSD